MLKKIAVSFATLALAVASAASGVKINLYQDTTVNGQQLKAGEYRVEVNDNRAVITSGKQSVEVPVKVENNSDKYKSTSVRYNNANGTMKIQEIHLGGTTTKLVFADTTASLR
jgi:Tfp pilus assembly major pilin PilA